MSLRAVPDVEGRVDDEKGGSMTDMALADAAENALGPAGPEADIEGEQGALLPACRVKFHGMAWDSLEIVPNLKEKMVFRVEVTITGHEQQVMADGDIRELAKAKCEKVTLLEE